MKYRTFDEMLAATLIIFDDLDGIGPSKMSEEYREAVMPEYLKARARKRKLTAASRGREPKT
jgi:hypothetical protein